MQRVKFLIIGAGPTGLGAAYKLKDQGEGDYLLLERNNWIGGLAASFVDAKGFTWDIGGHVQFSHYSFFDRAMDQAFGKDGWLTHERESWVWMRERFIPYPFQNNIRYLPKEQMWECLKGLMEAAQNPIKQKPTNFREWILASFGEGVAKHFMLPYNFKVWAYPPEQMNYKWIGERVATVDLKRIVENIIYEKMDASWGPNNTFRFPLQGGTGGIWRSIAQTVGLDKIRLNTEVLGICAEEQLVELRNGERIGYDHLLSTMPLDVLTAMVRETTVSQRKLAKQLKHSASNIIGLGIEGKAHELLSSKCWMYFPENNCPFYRMTVFSNYSPRNVPDDNKHYSLMCEVSESSEKPVSRTQVIEDTIRGLRANKLIPEDNKIVSSWSYSADYGYPTPSLKRDAILGEVIPSLDDLGIYSRGRFGGWKYEVSNQDHSFMQGVEWVQRITAGVDEQTYRVDTDHDPNLTVLRGLKETAVTSVPTKGIAIPLNSGSYGKLSREVQPLEVKGISRRMNGESARH